METKELNKVNKRKEEREMEVPEIITKNKYKYRYIKQVNERLYLYEEERFGWKECFMITDLMKIKSSKVYGKVKTINVKKKDTKQKNV